MRKILSSRSSYNNQMNDATVNFAKRYGPKSRMVSCGPNSLAGGLEVAGWPLDVFTKGAQIPDILMMIFNNPHNEDDFIKVRDLDFDRYPPNEVPQLYPLVTKIIYGKEACRFEWNIEFNVIKENIDRGQPLILCGNFPAGGHYVLCVGYDDEKQTVIFDDPYPVQWPDGNGFNREMSWNEMERITEKIRKRFLYYYS
jgi:hypothetical protein